MRIPSQVLLATVATASIAACNSGLLMAPGAGVDVEIVGVSRDSVGYTVSLRVTNRDTAVVGYFPHGCLSGVQTRSNGGDWAALPSAGACGGVDYALVQLQSVTFPIERQLLAAGNEVRVVFGWHYLHQPRDTGSTTTAPAAVQ